MKGNLDITTGAAKGRREAHLSKDGKWRSFPKVPNLLQYVISGTYYARCKVHGKPIRASLETDVTADSSGFGRAIV